MELRKRQVEDGRMELPDIYMVYIIICKCSCVSFSFYPGAFLRLYSRKCFFGGGVLKAHEEEV